MPEENQREIAVYALLDIVKEGGYNNIVLRKTLNHNRGLSNEGKAFITEIVNGTLRNLIYIDYVINSYSKISTEKMKPFILSLLRTGVYQIIFMDKTPDSAACNEAVKLAKEKKFKNLVPFVNGVLRNIGRKKNNIVLPDKNKDNIKHLSVLYSCPKWIIDYWLLEYCIDEIENMLQTLSKPPKISLCVNTLKTSRDSLVFMLEEAGLNVSKGIFDKALYVTKTSNISTVQCFKDGLFHIMDESSMASIMALDPKSGHKVMDVCAAPGGKSFFAAYIMENKGDIYSFDIHPYKIDMINDGAVRLGIDNLKADILDATKFSPEYENYADCLILDVPCSGLGLMRKKPDIKYSKTMDDVFSLSKLQKNIIDACWKYTKPGGTLVYSTCTLSLHENIENFNYLIENYPFTPVDFSGRLPDYIQFKEAKNGYLTIKPESYGFDGFFICVLRRNEL